MHVKKSAMPTTWPVPRKGKKFIAVPSHSLFKGITILFILRDILKIVRTRKEAKHMTLNGMVKVNNKIRKSEVFPLHVFDTLSFDESKKYYRLEIVNRKFSLNEISQKEAGSKIAKISGKTILSKNQIQMNLDDGQNFLVKNKFSVGDSALIDTKENKILKILELKKGSNVEIVSGKHAGKKGKIVGFEDLIKGRNYIIKFEDREVSLPFKSILVIE